MRSSKVESCCKQVKTWDDSQKATDLEIDLKLEEIRECLGSILAGLADRPIDLFSLKLYRLNIKDVRKIALAYLA